VLHAAFLPFGDIKDVSVPLDQGTQKNRGFGFVTFQEACVPVPCHAACGSACPQCSDCQPARTPNSDDAAGAMDNMHNAELYGRVLRCNYAQPVKIKGGDAGFSTQPVWADAQEWEDRLQQQDA
jgi:peptidyl-prolyl isomerase E (cyclophilin E)